MTVVQRAAEVAEVARAGAAWLEAHPRLKQDPSAPARDFRRFGRRAARLRAAAERPMCVAVFGASQAGKSYLVSSLATRPGEPLLAAYGDQRLNFLQDLNPPGGKESTGLVSRFTARGAAAPVGARVVPGSVWVNGQPLSPTASYRVTVNGFLAGGGDGFAVLRDGTSRVGAAIDSDAFAAYLEAHPALAPPALDRIQVLLAP